MKQLNPLTHLVLISSLVTGAGSSTIKPPFAAVLLHCLVVLFARLSDLCA